MNSKEFDNLLNKLRACSEAREWAEGKSLAEVWVTCERGEWMLWLCAKMIGKKGWPTRQEIVFAACSCAELSLSIFDKKHPNDARPRVAIETARRWARGEATIQEVLNAAHAAAYAAVDDAADAYAAAAAAAAAYASAANASAADAADAAHAAAFAAAVDAAVDAVDVADAVRFATLKKCADICRAQLKVSL